MVYRTSDIAKVAGIHVNTVRLYEKWGLLGPVQRNPKGYRLFNDLHLDQVLLIRMVFKFTWLGGEIRNLALSILNHSAESNFTESLDYAFQLTKRIKFEIEQAEVAIKSLEDWTGSTNNEETGYQFQIKDVARILDVTTDALRTWDRNGLIKVPRDKHNGYRIYGVKEINRLRIIRILRKSRFSLSAILRMLRQFDKGNRKDLRKAIDTPSAEEDVYVATDFWLTTLNELELYTKKILKHIEGMNSKHL